MTIFQNILNLFQSPRFVSFYWQAGSISLIGLLDLIGENIGNLGIPTWLVVLLGLVFSQITKALNNATQNKPMGFSKN